MQKKFTTRAQSRSNKRAESVLRSTYNSGASRIESRMSPPLSPEGSPLKISSTGTRISSKIEVVDEKSSSRRSPSHQGSTSSLMKSGSKSRLLKPLGTCKSPTRGMYQFSVYNGNNGNLIREMLKKRGIWTEVSNDDGLTKAHFIWKPTGFNPKIKTLETVKLRLQITWRIFEESQPKLDLFDLSNVTINKMLKQSSIDSYEFHQFVARYHQLTRGDSYMSKERTPSKHCEQNIWLVKPAAMNQGRGIEIFRSLRDITKFLTSRPAYTYWVIQKYLEKPLLYRGDRKFDIRIWVLYTSKGELYIYKEGYIRTTSSEYDIENQNNYVHLTNNCLQKFGGDYGKFEDGNTVSFEDFQQYLDEKFPHLQPKIEEHIMPRIKDIVIDSIQSIRSGVNPNKRKNSYELFGYDFMIDEDFRTWLIEVNSNPYIGIPNSFINRLLPEMLDDMLDIVVDSVYTPTEDLRNGRDNQYELIFDPNRGINQRRDFKEDLYPFEELKQLVGRFKKMHEAKEKKKKIAASASKSDKKELKQSLVQYPGSSTSQHPSITNASQSISQGGTVLAKSKDDTHTKSPYCGAPMAEFMGTGKKDNQRLSHSLKPAVRSKKKLDSKHIIPQTPQKFSQTSKGKPFVEIKTIEEENEEIERPNDLPLQAQTVMATPQAKFMNSTFNYSDKKGVPIQGSTQNNFQPQQSLVLQAQEICKSIQPVANFQAGAQIGSAGAMCERRDFNSIFNKIYSKFTQWEIFDDSKIQDATKALEILSNSRNIYYFTEEAPLTDLFRVLQEKEEVPLIIKESILACFEIISKSPALRKSICLFGELVQYLLKFSMESCDQTEYNESNDKMYKISISILINISCISSTKCYIPGETLEQDRLKQASIDNGILLVLYKLKEEGLFLKEDVHKEIQERVFDLVKIDEINYQINQLQTIDQTLSEQDSNALNTLKPPEESPQKGIFGSQKKSLKPPLAPASSLAPGHRHQLSMELQDKLDLSSMHQKFSEFGSNLEQQRINSINQDKTRKQKAQEDKRKQQEYKEREYREKQKRAEEQFRKRIEERRKLQIEQMKREMMQREQMLKDEEDRRKKMIEVLRKKEELRKQQQLDKYKQKLTEQQKQAEDIEKKRNFILDERAKNVTDNTNETTRFRDNLVGQKNNKYKHPVVVQNISIDKQSLLNDKISMEEYLKRSMVMQSSYYQPKNSSGNSGRKNLPTQNPSISSVSQNSQTTNKTLDQVASPGKILIASGKTWNQNKVNSPFFSADLAKKSNAFINLTQEQIKLPSDGLPSKRRSMINDNLIDDPTSDGSNNQKHSAHSRQIEIDSKTGDNEKISSTVAVSLTEAIDYDVDRTGSSGSIKGQLRGSQTSKANYSNQRISREDNQVKSLLKDMRKEANTNTGLTNSKSLKSLKKQQLTNQVYALSHNLAEPLSDNDHRLFSIYAVQPKAPEGELKGDQKGAGLGGPSTSIVSQSTAFQKQHKLVKQKKKKKGGPPLIGNKRYESPYYMRLAY